MDVDRIRTARDETMSNVRILRERRMASMRTGSNGRANGAAGVVQAANGKITRARLANVLVAGVAVVTSVFVVFGVLSPAQRHTVVQPLVYAVKILNPPIPEPSATPAAPKLELVAMQSVLSRLKHAKSVTLAAKERSDIGIAIIDGRLFLSDRQFAPISTDALVIQDSIPEDRTAVEKLLTGQPNTNDRLSTRKGAALAAEAEMLGVRRSALVRIASESLGPDTPVYEQLLKRRHFGDEIRLLISAHEYANSQPEREAVSLLVKKGVKVRQSPSNSKVAIDGSTVWIGSANATAEFAGQLDFGLVTTNQLIASRLRAKFDSKWIEAIAP